MVSGPEEFQASIQKPKMESDLRHHEQTKSTQVTFFNQVKALSNVIEEMGSPFIDDSNDLLVLDSRDLAGPAVINTMRNIGKTRQKKHENLSTKVLLTNHDMSMT
jgi:hypothetical protein